MELDDVVDRQGLRLDQLTGRAPDDRHVVGDEFRLLGSKLITPWFGAWLMSLLQAVVEGRSKKPFKTGLETRTQPFRDTVEVARKGLGVLGAEPPVVGVGGRTGIT